MRRNPPLAVAALDQIHPEKTYRIVMLSRFGRHHLRQHSRMTSPRYDCCPKCDHAPLPVDQSLPAACPACGIILAKFAALESADGPASSESDILELSSAPNIRRQLLDLMSYTSERVDPVAFWCRVILLALFTIWGIKLIALDYESGEMMSSFLHGPLLIFHEAGHVIFSLFGEFIAVLGGSLAQLLMPAIMTVALLIKNRDPFGAAMGTWLFGVSLLDLAPYVYDALDPQLILLGGHTGAEGGHDWIYLLSATGLLQRAHGLGSFVHKLGALLVLASIGWAVWILYQQKRRGVVRAPGAIE